MTLLFYNGKLLADGDYSLNEQSNAATFAFAMYQNDVIQVIKLDGLASSRKTISLDGDFSAGSEVPL